jgi:flagellar assembly protein FliH
MSSRILRPSQLESAEPLLWRHAGSAPPISRATSPKDAGQEKGNLPVSHGPSWEEYRELQARVRDLESQLPAREQQGRQCGQREAEAAASAKWQAALEKAAGSVVDAASFRGRLRREAEQDVIRLSVAMARRIVRRELAIDPEAMLGLVKTAVERLELRDVHRVRVRPEDAAAVTAYIQKIGGPARLEVIPDTALERGALLFETERGQLDASAETQLQEIERGFTDLLERRRDA